VGEEDLANLARPDPVRDPLLARQHRRIRSSRGNAEYGRRVSLDGGRFLASLATQEAEDDGYSDKGRASPHRLVRRGRAAGLFPGGEPERLRKSGGRNFRGHVSV
jgi:hypothetical protein